MDGGEDDPELQQQARRAVRFIYFLMVVLIALPAVLWWVFGR